jgi:hypothetical protein
MKFPLTVSFGKNEVFVLYPHHLVVAAMILGGFVWWAYTAISLIF